MTSFNNCASRHRKNIVTNFDVFCEIAWPEIVGQALSDGPVIITKYPEDFNDKNILRSLCNFSFPCGAVKSAEKERFSFVLTDEEGKFTFGYCYFNPHNNTCLCLLSGHKWDKGFFRMLDYTSSVINNGTASELERVLNRIYHSEIPQIGETANFGSSAHPLLFEVPDPHRLPTLEDDKYLHNFFEAIPYKQIIHIYASMLKERRIIFTCESLTQLSSCVQAASKMIYPMIWQSIYVPILPQKLIELLMAPMPFLVGVPKTVLNQTTLKNFGDLVIIDLDDKSFKSSINDVQSLPLEVYNHLKQALKSSDVLDHFKTFLQANVMLFGSYRNGFKRNEETKEITWSKRRFLASITKPSFHSYLDTLLGKDGSQYLERFIEDRIKSLSFGIPETEEFEKAITLYEKKEKATSKDWKEKEPFELIGNLIDKVAVNLTETMSKFDIKKPFGSLKKRESFNGALLSFDNEQFVLPNGHDNESEKKKESEIHRSTVDDLIDFSSPIEASKMALVPLSN